MLKICYCCYYWFCRYVVQVACGGFHSLALVRSLPPAGARTLSLDKCGRCQQLLYTMIDCDDHVIISDNHYCPLGVELNEAKTENSTPERQKQEQEEQPQGQRSQGQGSSEVNHEVNHVGSSMSSEAFCPAVGSAEGSKAENVAEPDEESTPTDPGPDTCKVQKRSVKRTRSSQFPDEQELKNYLKRMSDLSLTEQTSTASHSSSPSSPVSDLPATTPTSAPDLTPALAPPPPATRSPPGKPPPPGATPVESVDLVNTLKLLIMHCSGALPRAGVT